MVDVHMDARKIFVGSGQRHEAMKAALRSIGMTLATDGHDPAQVVVMGRASVAKVREALEWALLLAQAQHAAVTYGHCKEALALLPAEEMRT
jgi:hypothetical protein